jgi:hypothetical protein
LPEKKKDEDNFFVGIDSPTELRRYLLEASKTMVGVLKKYEAFKEKRGQKLVQIEKLKRIMADLARLNVRLKNTMPKTNLRVPHQILGLPDKPRARLPVSEEKEPATEMERLELELTDIESKLSKLKR